VFEVHISSTEKGAPMSTDEGFGEELKGTAKKVAGMATGNERLEREGEAQRQKADAARAAKAKEAEAAEAEQEARALEAEQREQQRR
jgi:uncharacterized protein YjbJ (UPF0337 family)